MNNIADAYADGGNVEEAGVKSRWRCLVPIADCHFIYPCFLRPGMFYVFTYKRSFVNTPVVIKF
jgi:hypothetical protein